MRQLITSSNFDLPSIFLFRILIWNVCVRQDMFHHHPASSSLPFQILLPAILLLLPNYKQDHQSHLWFLIKHQVLSHLLVHLCVSFTLLPLLLQEVDLLKISILASKVLFINQKTQEKVYFIAVVLIYSLQEKNPIQILDFHLNHHYLLNNIKILSYFYLPVVLLPKYLILHLSKVFCILQEILLTLLKV